MVLTSESLVVAMAVIGVALALGAAQWLWGRKAGVGGR
jgi:hypothetical protein